jgi:hypothetical protein
MENHRATIGMLDEVTRDMELDWPGSGRRFAEVETAPA